MGQTPGKWIATYEATTSEELAKAYGCWASEYDKDTCEGMGYVGPVVAADLLDRYLDSNNAKILDAGCGTGLVGAAMSGMGYERLEAMDYSQDMLREAESKEVYDNLLRADMNKRLPLGTNTYDATICVGTFTYAHVGPHAFDELTRITRPGGYLCFTIRDGAYQEYDYRQRMLELEAEKVLELKEMVDTDYLRNEDVSAKYCIYEVLEA